MVRIIIAVALISTASNAELILAIKSNDPTSLDLAAQAPREIRVVDVSEWRNVPQQIRVINPAHYPALIDLDTGAVIERPASWTAATNGLAIARAARDAAAPKKQSAKIKAARAEIENEKNWKAAMIKLLDVLEEE